MKAFCGGPFNNGHHEAVLEYIRETYGPLPDPRPRDCLPIEADLERTLPRHFALSIPGDITPGFPIPSG